MNFSKKLNLKLNSSSLCDNDTDFIEQLSYLYKTNESFKKNIDSFFNSFNQNKKIPISIEDLIRIEDIEIEKIKLIKNFIKKFSDGGIIDIIIDNHKSRLILVLNLSNFKESILNLIGDFDNIDIILNLAKSIEYFLLKLRKKINNILKKDFINSSYGTKYSIIDIKTVTKKETELGKEYDNIKENNKELKKEIKLFIKNLKEYIKNSKDKDISLSFDDFDLDNDYKLDKNLFDYLKDGVKNSKRWQHILQFISEKELNKFLKNYLKIDTDNEKVILDIGINERLSPDDIEKLEAQAINRNTSFDSKIDIKDFLPILQIEINKRVLEKDPNSKLENYEILQSHFTIMFNTRQNTYIYPEMFDDREKVFKNMLRKKNYGKKGRRKKINKTRWDYIYDIMSKKELKQFLLNFLQNR